MINIKEVIETLQNDLRKQGIPYLARLKHTPNNLMITCPYHKNGQESTPSCGVLYKDKMYREKVHKAGTVHCFTCGATHTLEEMISHVYGKNDRGAYGKEWLLEKFNILSTSEIEFNYDFTIQPIKQEVEYTQFKSYHPYFANRGVSEKVAEAFDLGYDEYTDSVVLPLFDKSGKCIMLIKRAVSEHAYMNTSGASKTDSVFGIQMIYKKLSQLSNSPYVFVAEGAFDVIKLWQAGYPAVGILQASISQNQVDLIKKLPFQKVVIATDNDKAGRDIAIKLAQALSGTKEVFFLRYPFGVKDPADMTAEQLKDLKLEVYHSGKKTGFTTSIY